MSQSKTGMKMVRGIKDNLFAISIATLAMIGQSKHTFDVFIATHLKQGQKPDSILILQGIIIALVIDAAVIYYTIRKRKDISMGAAVVMCMINACAYWLIHRSFTIEFAFGMIYGLAIPLSVHFYSETVEHEQPRQKKQPQKKTRLKI